MAAPERQDENQTSPRHRSAAAPVPRPRLIADQLTAVLTTIEARGRVQWDAAAGVYQPCIPPEADRSTRADTETVAVLMTFLRHMTDGTGAGSVG